MKNTFTFSKFIQYVLGHRPDEFGLVADENGYFPIKTLLQALHEDPECRFVRQSHLNELLLAGRPSPIEIQGHLIRLLDRSHMPSVRPAADPLPKLLYVPIRRRSHAAVAANGVHPYGGSGYVILSPVEEMARRLGRRIDPHPLLISVPTINSTAAGVDFMEYGELFLAPHLPAEAIICPPVVTTAAPKVVKPAPDAVMKTPGGFFLDPARIENPSGAENRIRIRRSDDWKKERSQARKYKKRMQNVE